MCSFTAESRYITSPLLHCVYLDPKRPSSQANRKLLCQQPSQCQCLTPLCNAISSGVDQVTNVNLFDLQGNADYFITSGDKIRFFFEKGVFDDKGELWFDSFH